MSATSLDFLTTGYPWPPPSEVERFNKYEENKMLFEGKHNLVYSSWIKLLREDQKATLEIILNWHKRLSTLWADMLLGEPPKFKSEPEDAVTKHTTDKFLNDCYMTIIDVSRFGDGLLKVRLKNGVAIIEPNTPQVWIPVTAFDNVQEVLAHVLAWVIQKVDNKGRDIYFLRVEIHTIGLIQNKLFELKQNFDQSIARFEIGKEIELSIITEFKDVLPIQETGVDDFLVIPIHNLITSDRSTGFDDYSDIDSIIQELEIRIAQLSKILDEHAAPTLAGPDSLRRIDPRTGQVSFDGLGKYIPMAPEDSAPEYLTWDVQIEAIQYEIDTLLQQLFIISETSAAAFGDLKQGLAESGSALKRLMLAPLAKVNRLRLRLDPALKKALTLASELEVVNNIAGAKKITDVKIEWQDGLPADDTERAVIDSQEYAAGIVSLDTILRRRGFDGEALEEEKKLIEEDKKAEAVTVPEINLDNSGSSTGGA